MKYHSNVDSLAKKIWGELMEENIYFNCDSSGVLTFMSF